jgi:hypoxanthine-DNA glycosylase
MTTPGSSRSEAETVGAPRILSAVQLVHPLGPICDARTRVLILGSFPGVASLRARQYYGHPRNHFWRLLGAVIGEPLHEMEYSQRLPLVLASGFGVWDVIAACQREGSLDSSIKNEQPNDFAGLLARYPDIRRFALNGGKAARYRRVLEATGREVVVLPSSSPANATHSFERKLLLWKQSLGTESAAS